jgi:hypothetical protein
MLQQGRYTWRHDSILSSLKHQFSDFNKKWTIITDLPGDNNKKGPSTIPPDVLPLSNGQT